VSPEFIPCAGFLTEKSSLHVQGGDNIVDPSWGYWLENFHSFAIGKLRLPRIIVSDQRTFVDDFFWWDFLSCCFPATIPGASFAALVEVETEILYSLCSQEGIAVCVVPFEQFGFDVNVERDLALLKFHPNMSELQLS